VKLAASDGPLASVGCHLLALCFETGHLAITAEGVDQAERRRVRLHPGRLLEARAPRTEANGEGEDKLQAPRPAADSVTLATSRGPITPAGWLTDDCT